MTANRISPDLDKTWVDRILGFMEPVGYGPTTLPLSYSDRITSYGYCLKIISSGWSFAPAVLGQMAYLVASLTLDSARSYVMQGAPFS
ncbi:hypothetical protein Tco_0873129 [Tanacetum coccineum]